jgi:hypothetical protein
MARITREIGEPRMRTGRFPDARALFVRLSTGAQLTDFLTSAAYAALDDARPITID